MIQTQSSDQHPTELLQWCHECDDTGSACAFLFLGGLSFLMMTLDNDAAHLTCCEHLYTCTHFHAHIHGSLLSVESEGAGCHIQ